MNPLTSTIEHVKPCYRFIAIEGVDAAGKSLLTSNLVPFIQKQLDKYAAQYEANFNVKGFTPWEGSERSQAIRSMFLGHNINDPMIEMMLIFAARRDLILNKIKPWLDGGGFGVIDRYVATTFAYQGFNHQIPSFMLWADLMRQTCERILPGLTIYLDVDDESVRERLALRGQPLDSIEERNAGGYGHLRAGFQAAFSVLKMTSPESVYTVIDANMAPEVVLACAKDIAEAYIERLFSTDAEVIERTTKTLDMFAFKAPEGLVS